MCVLVLSVWVCVRVCVFVCVNVRERERVHVGACDYEFVGFLFLG